MYNIDLFDLTILKCKSTKHILTAVLLSHNSSSCKTDTPYQWKNSPFMDPCSQPLTTPFCVCLYESEHSTYCIKVESQYVSFCGQLNVLNGHPWIIYLLFLQVSFMLYCVSIPLIFKGLKTHSPLYVYAAFYSSTHELMQARIVSIILASLIMLFWMWAYDYLFDFLL